MELKLPDSLISSTDINRLLRDLETRESQFITSIANGSAISPVTNKTLEDLASLNGYNLMDRTHCWQLKNNLEKMAPHLPELHISFATEASQAVVQKLTSWLRTNIHPGVLVKIGLQPSIAAGCVLRTPNRVFDMSLQAYIRQQEPYLEQLIQGAVRGS